MIPLRIWWLSVAAAAAFSFASLPPASAQTPPVAAAPNDPFGKEVSLVEKNIVYVAGSGMWESAFSTIVAAFKTVYGAMAKQGLKASGAPMTIYTATDDGLTSQPGYISINIQHVNQPPVARSSSGQVQQDGVAQVYIFAGDSDFDPLTYRLTVAP